MRLAAGMLRAGARQGCAAALHTARQHGTPTQKAAPALRGTHPQVDKEGVAGGLGEHVGTVLGQALVCLRLAQALVGGLHSQQGGGRGGSVITPLFLSPLPPSSLPPSAPLRFGGHVLSPATDSAGQDVSLLLPRLVPGKFLGANGGQAFSATDELLALGMCGGPVMDEHGHCVGMVEGVVPRGEAGGVEGGGGSPQERAARLLAGAAVFVGSDEIGALLRRVEAGGRRRREGD